MNEAEIKVLEINDKKYFLVDTLSDDKNTYSYFSNIEDNSDIKILKEIKEDNEEFFISLDNQKEIDTALKLFYQKHQKAN